MPRRPRVLDRSLAIQRVSERLVRDSFPRLQMLLLVGLTGLFGLLSSFVLLHLGLDSMALRYPSALFAAYLFFLFLLWLWLRTTANDYADVPDFLPDMPGGGSDVLPGLRSGGGGDFGGGGASGSFDSADWSDGTSAPSVGDTAQAVAEADEFGIPLLAIAFAFTLVVASLYVVYIAPVLFAELLVDGALSYALFRHLRGQPRRHWLAGTFRRTLKPFIATALFLLVIGAAMSFYAPGSATVGQVIQHAQGHVPAH
jgi:hypothetical protein